MDFNILATSFQERGRQLVEDLREYGEFRLTEFRDVVVGKVEDVEGFLDKLSMVPSLSKIVPLDKVRQFELDVLLESLKKDVEAYLDKIEPGETFCVRVDRRGFKGKVSSQELAREIGGHLYDLLEEKYRVKPKVDLKDPDKMVVVEILGNKYGVGLVTKAMRLKCSYLR